MGLYTPRPFRPYYVNRKTGFAINRDSRKLFVSRIMAKNRNRKLGFLSLASSKAEKIFDNRHRGTIASLAVIVTWFLSHRFNFRFQGLTSFPLSQP